MTDNELPTPEQLRKLLRYDPEEGSLFWLLPRQGVRSGDPVSEWHDRKGYAIVTIKKRKYRAHRVAWAVYYGKWPREQIDHINGNPADNKITNLRDVTPSENQRNTKRRCDNRSGVTGVRWNSVAQKWVAEIWLGGKSTHLGLFARKRDAINARKSAESAEGFHANHGR